MRQPESSRRARTVVIGTVAVIAADQVTKALAEHLASDRTGGAIVPLRNQEFSLGVAAAPEQITVLICAVGIVAFGVHLVRETLRRRLDPWLTALVMGGALSNLVDRLLGGSVRDFLATPWVVFNLADVAVLVGLIGYLSHLRAARTRTALLLEEVRT